MTDRELHQHVLSLTVCDHNPCQSGFDLLGGNSSRLDDCAARIAHRSTNASCDLLSGNIQACKQGHHQQRQRLRATHAFPHLSSRVKSDVTKYLLVGALESARENWPTD